MHRIEVERWRIESLHLLLNGIAIMSIIIIFTIRMIITIMAVIIIAMTTH